MLPRIVQERILALVALCVLSLSVGCRDRFECGIQLDGEPTRCTGATEVCLCSERRCAKTSPDVCPESGYEYVFPEGDRNRCVPPAVLAGPVISGRVDGVAALCPDQADVPPRCGVEVSGTVQRCPGNQTCLCDLNVCASFQRTDDCPTGWRLGIDDTCIDLTNVNPNIRPAEDGLCAGARLPSPRISCGRPNEIGLIEDCPEDQTCICGTNRCAIADAAACPDTRFRYAPEAAGDPAECVGVDDAMGERVTDGACSEFRPSPIACGDEGLSGGPTCPDPAQRCVCETRLCAEDAPGGSCPGSGLRYVGSGECITPAELATTIADGLCAPTCGVLGGDGRIVQCPFGECVCGDGSGQCAVTDGTCPTGRAFVADDACVTFTATTPAQTLATGQVCPMPPEDTPCGRPGADGRLARCGADEVCVCEGATGRCARAEATCPDGRAFVPTNRCAPADGGAVTTVRGLLCPQRPPGPPVVCGALDGVGRVQACLAGEQCICRPAGGTCAAVEPACPFGFAEANTGVCVALSGTDFTRPVAPDQLCPPRPPTAVACGAATDADCTGLGCACRADGAGVCVETQNACPSGLAETETLRCLAVDEATQLITSGPCPAGGL